MTWEDNALGTGYAREVVILEKNVRDLQKQLNQAHKRIKTLVDQNTRKNVSLKAVGKIVDEELGLVSLITNKEVGFKAIKEIVRKETEADIDGIVSL